MIGLSVLGVFLYKPSYIGHFEWRLHTWYLTEHAHELEAIEKLDSVSHSDEIDRRLRATLAELGQPRKGEKRFELWRKMNKKLASRLVRAGHHLEGLEVFRKVLDEDPLDVDLRGQLASALRAEGSESSLQELHIHLDFLQQRLPNSVSVKMLQMSVSAHEGDWDSVAKAYLSFETGAAHEFLSGWQAFAYTRDGELLKTPLLTANRISGSSRSQLKFEFGKLPGMIHAIRLDPPAGKKGVACDYKLTMWDGDGQEITNIAVALETQVGMQIIGGKDIQSDGGNDPRCRLALTPDLELDGTLTLDLTFVALARIPDEVQALAESAGAEVFLDAAIEALRGGGD